VRIRDETLKSIVWMGSLGTVRRADEGVSGCGFQIERFFLFLGWRRGGGGFSRRLEGREL